MVDPRKALWNLGAGEKLVPPTDPPWRAGPLRVLPTRGRIDPSAELTHHLYEPGTRAGMDLANALPPAPKSEPFRPCGGRRNLRKPAPAAQRNTYPLRGHQPMADWERLQAKGTWAQILLGAPPTRVGPRRPHLIKFKGRLQGVQVQGRQGDAHGEALQRRRWRCKSLRASASAAAMLRQQRPQTILVARRYL